MNIVTYRSSNAKPSEAWLAYIVLPSGEQWLVRFAASTEEAAIAAAKARWESEQARYKRHNELEPVLVDDCQASPVRSGRGSHASAMFSGKVWVINRVTHDLKRIDPNELDIYVAQGYVRGGPRSK
jgi:hypothetical protein